MKAIVVSDTSPLRALDFLHRLEWLGQLFVRVVIPPAVSWELSHPPGRIAPLDLVAFPFIEVRPVLNLERVAFWCQKLHQGESEALALAEELGSKTILMDEAHGRALAQAADFSVVGTLGILLKAKAAGLCFEVAPLLTSLQQDLNFFISRPLREAILKQAGEHD